MKSFTQRWREASDEAEDQPMEDTLTDPKEAQVIIGTATQHINELLVALAEQTERADRLQAQIHDLCHDKHVTGPVTPEDFCKGCEEFQIKLFGTSPITRLTAELDAAKEWRNEAEKSLVQAGRGIADLIAELDAVRKDAEWLRSTLTNREKTLTNTGNDLVDARTQRDAAQAKCAELEKLIQDAPHEEDCGITYTGQGLRCDCWKSRLTPAQQASAWRPIETAPKTGDDFKAIEILGWIPDYADVIDGGDRDVIYWEPRKEQWFCRGHAVPNPTHWQPLPAPPEEKRP